jgi:hypothetical protein
MKLNTLPAAASHGDMQEMYASFAHSRDLYLPDIQASIEFYRHFERQPVRWHTTKMP